MLRLKNRVAQSTAEYVIVLGLIVAAVVAMQTYIKRGLQGRIKDAVDYKDQAGQSANVVQFTTNQYEPYYISSNFVTNRSSDETENMEIGGGVNKESNESSNRTGSQVIGGVSNSTP